MATNTSVELAEQLCRDAGLPPGAPPEITGDDPVFPTRFRVGTAGAAALAAVGAGVSALWELKTGRPQGVSVEVRRAAASLRSQTYVRVDGEKPRERPEPVSGLYQAHDGAWVYLHCSFPHHEARALARLDIGPSREDVARVVAGWDAGDLEEAIVAAGGVAARVRTAAEWRDHPQYRALMVAPLLEITRIGDAPRQPLPDGPRPLSGIRVLDLTRVLAGPSATRTLAEHGAQVLKIAGPHQTHPPDGGSIELDTGIGKRTATLDLREEAGCAVLRDLAAGADVFVQSFRPGAIAQKGFAPETVAALRPGIVYVTLSAWGSAGPWGERRGFDSVVQTVSGMADVSRENGRPKFLPVSAIDYVSGTLMAFGAMVALRRRALEGGSWHVRVSLARVGRWIVERGMLAPELVGAVSAELPEADMSGWFQDMPAPAGRVRTLRPALQLSETPGHWDLPPVPLGTHAPAWIG